MLLIATGGAKMTIFRPMLSAMCEDITKVRLPALASPKLDGIRCVIRDGKPVTRSLKPIPNRYVRDLLIGLPPFDGELLVGDPVARDTWNATQSGIMSEHGKPDFRYFAFDMMCDAPKAPFVQRHKRMSDLIDAELGRNWLVPLDHIPIANLPELEAYEAKAVELGFEGIMLRNPGGLYKHGRSTMREQGLLKIKRFNDAEAIVIAVVERETNLNPSMTNALGLTQRSSSKRGKKAPGSMGSLVCRLSVPGRPTEFEIGTGFDEAMRSSIWAAQAEWIGACVKFKYQTLSPDGVPRFPVFLGLR